MLEPHKLFKEGKLGKGMNKSKFWCTSCKYKFQRTSQPILCPYCGKKSVEQDLSKGAEDLLKEISDMDQD